MPYVEGFGSWPFGEEWLFEAVASSYLPLLDVVDGVPLTLTVTPVLADQLEALRGGDVRERFSTFLRDTRVVVHRDDAAQLEQEGKPELAAELRRAAADYERADADFDEIGGDLVGAIGRLDSVELWTSAATHAVLPLLATRVGTALQLVAGIESHQRRFGAWGGGFWLPECAFRPWLEGDLAEQSVRIFCTDQTDAFGLGSQGRGPEVPRGRREWVAHRPSRSVSRVSARRGTAEYRNIFLFPEAGRTPVRWRARTADL